MRTLTSTLLAAQKQASATPFVQAVFSDYHGDISRLRFNRHYTGSEGAYFSAAAIAGDGALIRARVDPSTKVLYTQRVASPSSGSDFSSWTSHGAVSASGAVALAASGASVLLFYVDADTITLKQKQSADNGASYGAATTVATAASPVTYLAAAFATGGDLVLFWTVGAAVWKSRHSGGAWGSPAAWTNTVASITGLACAYRVDWDVVVCGTASGSGDAKVWTAIYGDDGFQTVDTWSVLRELTQATASSNVTFLSPAVEFLQHWRLFFVEKHSASQTYSRLQWSTMNATASFDLDLWREPVPFDYESDYGVAAAVGGGNCWLSAPAAVWSAASPSAPNLDVSNDVVEVEVDLSEYDGSARLVLRNAGAGGSAPYGSYGAGDLGALQRGARLQLAAGYRTSAGAEASTGPAYWVDAIEQVTGAAPRLVVHAQDAWAVLQQWRARRQFFWAAGTKTVSQLIEFVCARAGLDFGSTSTSAAFTTFKPAFTIMLGQDGKTAVLRLLALVPDEAIMRSGACLTLHPQAADASVYDYAAGSAPFVTTHALVTGRYRDDGPAVNRVRVIGAGVFNEAFDFSEIDHEGERTRLVNDINLTSAGLAGDRAASDLRAAEVRDRRDEIGVFGVNCGQELYDVVSLTDAQAGLANAKRRVLGLSWRYATGLGPSKTPRYDMTLRLGSP